MSRRRPRAGIEFIKTQHWGPLAARHAAGAWEALDAAYADPSRGYHSWDHIADLLEKLDEFQGLAARKEIVAMACFWHDAVYVTRDGSGRARTDAQNVRESVALFERYAVMDSADAEAVADLILATLNHAHARPRKEHYDGFQADFDLFLDLDLSALGAPWPVFMANFENIRHEFGWVPELAFQASQLRGLQGFAQLGTRLFRRKETREAWGASAAVNLARCVGELAQKASRAAPPRTI